MLKADIDVRWPLVLQRQEEVLRVLDDIARNCRAIHRFDRAALVRLYRPGRDLSDLARYFAVSPGSINSALSRLVRIARGLERTETLQRAANGKRYVVIVPVDHLAEGEYVQTILATHDLRGVVEALDAAEDWRRPSIHRRIGGGPLRESAVNRT